MGTRLNFYAAVFFAINPPQPFLPRFNYSGKRLTFGPVCASLDTSYGWRGQTNGLTVYYMHHDLEHAYTKEEYSHGLLSARDVHLSNYKP